MRTVGAWIKTRRETLKLTQQDVVRLTGLSVATIARLEADEGGKSRSTLLSVANALRVRPPDLLADWGTGIMSERQFVDRFTGNVFRPPEVRAQEDAVARGRSAEAFLAERGLHPTVTRRTLPPVEFMIAEPGRGTPILGEITAGGMVESLVFDDGDEPERIPLYYPDRARTYALRIRGDSMSPEYRAGEILVVQDATRDDLEDGEDAVIQCDGSNDGCSTFKRCVFVGPGMVRLMPLNDQYRPIDCPLESIVRIGKVLGVYRPKQRTQSGRAQ